MTDKQYDELTRLIETYYMNLKVSMSQFLAEKEYGTELVSEVMEYFNEHPDKSWLFKNSVSPWHDAVEFYQNRELEAA